ncbi:hypothetical protein KZJ38_23945 [Paraburkholderia edwinii]|uniref:Uncharacterized protein n=1 Tax=Paraburkholderia edwinii TaxID=2861782 RepID=A0ABX8UUR3_9BURK|nr:hypothetical protein [Paraburkholderia edwinii]QYD72748.1 hypothetical protein KZJ38_23945 [Paraburkholderia edwinii]
MISSARTASSNDPALHFTEVEDPRVSDNSLPGRGSRKQRGESNQSRERAGRGGHGRTSGAPKLLATQQQLNSRAIASASPQNGQAPLTGSGRTWSTSGAYIKGSAEYDLADDDKQSLEKLRQAYRDAKEIADDDKKGRSEAHGGSKTHVLDKIYRQAEKDAETAKKALDEAEPVLSASIQKHLNAAAPYVGGKWNLDENNRLVRNKAAGASDWVYSATDTRDVLDQAAKNAKDKIDAGLKDAWEEEVNDIRAWREKNVPGAQNPNGIDAEDIDRRMYEDSEAYILLRKNADQRKEAIDRAVSAFKNKLAANRETVTREVGDNGSKDQKKLLDSMSERTSNLDNAIAGINDQRNMFASLSAETVNRMRVGTNKTTVQPYVSEQSKVPGGRDGANAEGQREIDSAAQNIETYASQVANAAHDALPMGIPNSVDRKAQERLNDKFDEAQHAMLRDLRSVSTDLKDSLKNLSESTTRLGDWTVPGTVELPSVVGVLALGKSLVEFDEHLASYLEKKQQGKLTSDDKQQMMDDVRHMVGNLVPFIPVIGPVLTPFITIGNTIVDLVEENKPSPVQSVAAVMQSQTARNLGRDYSPVAQPQI